MPRPRPGGVDCPCAAGTIRRAGRLAQLVERLPYKQEVTGSSPVPPIADCLELSGFLLPTVVRRFVGQRRGSLLEAIACSRSIVTPIAALSGDLRSSSSTRSAGRVPEGEDV